MTVTQNVIKNMHRYRCCRHVSAAAAVAGDLCDDDDGEDYDDDDNDDDNCICVHLHIL